MGSRLIWTGDAAWLLKSLKYKYIFIGNVYGIKIESNMVAQWGTKLEKHDILLVEGLGHRKDHFVLIELLWLAQCWFVYN